MTFNIIADGDPGLASTAMQNWRHVNYGNALMPVSATGASVDSTIDIGSPSYYFKNAYIDSLLTTGNVGIGMDAPITKLHVNVDSGSGILSVVPGANSHYAVYGAMSGGASGILGYRDGSGGNWGLFTNGNGYFAGNVGIDNSSPGTIKDSGAMAKLQVGDGSASEAISIKAGTNGFAYYACENDARSYLAGIGTDDNYIIFDTTSGTDAQRFTITSGGNVGIENTSPGTIKDSSYTAKLQIGDGSTVDMVASIKAGTNGDGLIAFENDARCYTMGINGTADTFDIYDETANATRLSIDSTGNAAFSAGVSIAGKLNIGSSTELTIVGTSIAVTKSFHTVDTAADAATGNLEALGSGTAGDIVVLMAEHTDRTVVVKNSVVLALPSGDYSLDTDTKSVVMMCTGGAYWVCLSTS